MATQLSDYEPIVGREVVDELCILADSLKGRRLQNINSTSVGGGVAELLGRIVPLMRQIGIDATWDVMRGSDAFFQVTKELHNALHGAGARITRRMLEVYREVTEMNAGMLTLGDDVIVVHDPQPAGLIGMRDGRGRRWIWRCHIDISAPAHRAWAFLKPFVERYDAAVFSMPEFAQSLAIPQYMVTPSIDPLSDKNRDLEASAIAGVMRRHGVDPERPIITQVSRFDRLKDPLGVIEAYRLVKRAQDCQLVLAGGGATDDPEGQQVLDEVREAAAGDPDIHILLLPPFSDIDINAIVRASTVVLQKSIREGFGLTVSEALWKRKPVVAGAVGGIKLQVVDGFTGYLVHSPEGAARRLGELLRDPKLRRRLGENGYQHVKQNFLLTRHVKDILLLMHAVEHPGEDIVTLR